jgi:hypothetical protein
MHIYTTYENGVSFDGYTAKYCTSCKRRIFEKLDVMVCYKCGGELKEEHPSVVSTEPIDYSRVPMADVNFYERRFRREGCDYK